MSQAVTNPSAEKPAAHIPPAFLRTPINPHSEKVRAGLAQPETPPAQPPVAPVAAPVAAPVTPAEQPAFPPQQVAPSPVAAPQAAPVQQPAPAQPQVAPAPQQPPMYVQPPTVPVVDQYLLQQLAQERDRLSAELGEKDKVIGNLLTTQQELAALKQQAQMQEALAATNFDGLETVDPEDAKRISAAVLAATQATIAPLQKQLEDERQRIQAQTQQQMQYMEQQRIQSLNQQVLSVHPDFFQLQSSPAYHAFMSQRDGLSSKTRDQRAAEEFMAGNTAYVIDMLNQMKGASPSPAQIATVAPVQSAPAAPAAPAAQTPPMTLRELNDLMGTRQITHDEYRARLKELRAANNV